MKSLSNALLSVIKAEFRDHVPTKDELREVIDEFCILRKYQELTDEQRENVAKSFEMEREVKMGEGDCIVDQKTYHPWYQNAKAEITPYYADRYLEYLRLQKGVPSDVVTVIDNVTDKLCDFLGDPRLEGGWDRRGMVVGHVQSGKTANYLSLVCKAADAGYKLIVIIAGLHNNLRQQTQERVDEGFLGFDTTNSSKKGKAIGVGKIRDDKTYRPIPLTSTDDDFLTSNKNAINFGLAQTKVTVLVIKKNSTVLANLIKWIGEDSDGPRLNHHPLLLIDDEADNASIDTSKDPDKATRINQQIRELLQLFERRTYVGYTATPFANIFISPDTSEENRARYGEDLFPRDFIYALDSPSNYMGADRMFGIDADLTSAIHPVSDFADVLPLKHKKEHVCVELPKTLIEAMMSFILARAIRLSRGDNKAHMSMLVNVSRFTDVQSRLKVMVLEQLKLIERAIRYDQKQQTNDRTMQMLRQVWIKYKFDQNATWESIYPYLVASASPIEVMAVNSNSQDSLEYKNHDEGRTVIAIGGFSLSRGLTLEGLMVSYLLRNTKMYDTLLQMGRWFGYRGNYEDVCRLFLTEQSRGWYEFITRASQELRSEIVQMVRANRTPADFGLKVARHPDALLITARNKMRSGERFRVQIGLSCRFIETTRVFGPTIGNRLESDLNFGFAKRLIAQLSTPISDAECLEIGNNDYLWSNVDLHLIREFIGSFQNHEFSINTQTEPLLNYINARPDELEKWDVVIKGGGGLKLEADVLGLSIARALRKRGENPYDENGHTVIIGDRHRVGDAEMERLGLPVGVVSDARKAWVKSDEYNAGLLKNQARKGDGASGPSIPGYWWRRFRRRPLLILHVIEMQIGGQRDETLEGPVLAYSISFPISKQDSGTVEYLVNPVWVKMDGFNDYDEDEDDDD